MKAIAILTFCVGAITSSAAKPPLFLSYQDSIGQYSFGYSEPAAARSEYRGSDGVTRGAYSYLDSEGQLQSAEYEAGDGLGFRLSATNLPRAPPATPEVLAATQTHLRLLEEARRRDLTAERLPRTPEPRSAGPIAETEAAPKSATDGAAPVALRSEGDAKLTMDKTAAPIPTEAGKAPEVQARSREEPRAAAEAAVPVKPSTEAASESRPGDPSAPVGYTPEVTAARAAHFRAYEAAARLAAQSDLEPQLLGQLLLQQPSAKLQVLERMDEARPDAPGAEMTENAVGEARPSGEPTSLNPSKSGSGYTPASTSLRIMDIRLPSLNEFQQTKLKAGAYNTPIEISHLSPTNVLPKPYYHPFFGSSTFYVYL